MTKTEWLAVVAIIIQIVGICIQSNCWHKSQPSPNPKDKSPYPFANFGAKYFFISKLSMLLFAIIGAILIYSEMNNVSDITSIMIIWVSVGTVMVAFGMTSLFWLFVMDDVLGKMFRR